MPDNQDAQYQRSLHKFAVLSIPMLVFLFHSLAFRVDMPKPGKYLDIPVLTFGLGLCTFTALHHNPWRPMSRNLSVLVAIMVCLGGIGWMFLRLNWVYDGWVEHE